MFFLSFAEIDIVVEDTKNIMLTPSGIVTPSGMTKDYGGLTRLHFVYNFHPYIFDE